jgi:hypothetical protein
MRDGVTRNREEQVPHRSCAPIRNDIMLGRRKCCWVWDVIGAFERFDR